MCQSPRGVLAWCDRPWAHMSLSHRERLSLGLWLTTKHRGRGVEMGLLPKALGRAPPTDPSSPGREEAWRVLWKILSIPSSVSLVKIWNSTGPNTDLWGTPLVTPSPLPSGLWAIGHSPVEVTTQPLSYPSYSPHIKSISVQFRVSLGSSTPSSRYTGDPLRTLCSHLQVNF